MEQLLSCHNLTKRYGYKTALDSINLTIERGRIIGLLGPNGSGKTTLIKLINGLLAPTEGVLLINGEIPGPETKKVVSYLPERTYFNSWMEDMWRSFPQIFGVPAGIGVPMFLLTGLIDTIAGTVIIYMCISIGHSFNDHKVLASIGIYMGYKFVTNMLNSIVAALSGIGYMENMSINSIFFGINMYGSGFSDTSYFWFNIAFSLVFSLALGIGAFVLTNHFMTKRLNLE
ncbi:MAG: ATP-binding cassette domain-containing protein [Lachnospiraceae bacterium]|nr:ATP-binding cassette domain-containing protein [Lachnospiraceae bacterium]